MGIGGGAIDLLRSDVCVEEGRQHFKLKSRIFKNGDLRYQTLSSVCSPALFLGVPAVRGMGVACGGSFASALTSIEHFNLVPASTSTQTREQYRKPLSTKVTPHM